MARPKGSKNAVRTKKANIDYAAIVAEKTAAKEQIETEIAALSDNISTLKEQLKSKKSALKVAVKELSKAEAKKVAAEKKLLYYTVFIALEEEFLIRGICVYWLKDENNYIRYLVPNILFAAMHLFSYASWGEITPVYVFSFITSQMLGLILTGCIFQYLKEKSGTIWIPVLVHAILDYMVVLSY